VNSADTSISPAARPVAAQAIGVTDNMVRMPAGTFRTGSDRHYAEEAPSHKVRVDGFWIDRYILDTSFEPTWDELGRLASVAAIRTLLSFFLDREFDDTRNLQQHVETARIPQSSQHHAVN
jgi:hypothetical protein